MFNRTINVQSGMRGKASGGACASARAAPFANHTRHDAAQGAGRVRAAWLPFRA